MKHLQLSLSLVLFAFAAAAPTAAQQPDVLFTYLSNPQPAQGGQTVRLDEYVRQRDFVGLHLDAMFGARNEAPATRVGLNLPAELRTARFSRLEIDPKGHRSWIGSVEGSEASLVVLTELNGVVYGVIDIEGDKYQVRTVGDGVHALEHLNAEAFGEELEPLLPRARTLATAATPEGDPATDDRGTIDVLMLYTPAARHFNGADVIQNMAANVIATTNEIFARSGITTRVRMAGTPTEFALTETPDMTGDLITLTDSRTAQALRNQFSADLVQLLIVGPSAVCGTAWQFNDINAVDYDGYSLAKTSCIAQYTPTHEIGHNMGSQHDRRNAAFPPLFDYSYGYADPAGRFRTVMAIRCGDSSCARIPYFSNPQIIDANSGAVTGTALENNAASINHAAQTVANWRQSMNTPAAPTGLLAQVTSNSVTLSWAASVGATSYMLQVGSTTGVSNVFNGSVGNVTTISGAAPAGNYFFRVIAVNDAGPGPPSQEAHFTIGGPAVVPDAPAILQSSVIGTTVTLSWNESSGATSYILQVGTNAGASNLFNQAIGNQTGVSGPVGPGTYFWRVIASNSAGNSQPSAERQFSVTGTCETPGAPQNFTFALAGRTVTFTWVAPASGPGVTSYVLEAGSATGLANLASVPIGTAVSFTTQAPPGTFFLRVRGQNACGTGPASNEQVVVVP